VDDLIEGVLRLFHCAHPGPVNLGNPDEYRILELAEQVRGATGARVAIEHRPLPQDDPKVRQPDITLARELLGWEPRVSLAEGLARTVAYFREILPEITADEDRRAGR
jgi:nucleoside-diphosphate-sugar epimerase